MNKQITIALVVVVLIIFGLLLWRGSSRTDTSYTATSTTPGMIRLTTKINQAVSGLDVTITPLEVLEDSRCPANANCIQMGTVRVRALLASGLGSSEEIFTLNQPITTEAEAVTLLEVKPQTQAEKTIKPDEYSFVFEVQKRDTLAFPVQFLCAEGKTLSASFASTTMELKLDTGRNLSLNKVSASSGARYSSSDGTIVFSNQGSAATLEEKGVPTYQNCQELGK